MMLTAVVLVGRRILLGPLLGTAVLIVQQNLLSLGGDWNKVTLGLVLAAVLIFWPSGLMGVVEHARRHLRREAAPVEQA
jgi:branched-chain amino acid transport system permease protein